MRSRADRCARLACAAAAGSGVTGSATLTPGDRIEIVVTIDGGLEEGSHESHIHQGACLAAGGSVEFSLNNVEADSSGTGYASSRHFDAVLLPYLQDGNHYISVHDHAGPIVTCGDIPTAS